MMWVSGQKSANAIHRTQIAILERPAETVELCFIGSFIFTEFYRVVFSLPLFSFRYQRADL